ncbi:MAG: hypothetical protein ABDH66_06875 [Bacteroidia bacterium]
MPWENVQDAWERLQDAIGAYEEELQADIHTAAQEKEIPRLSTLIRRQKRLQKLRSVLARAEKILHLEE